jgi:hypothetical protein
MILYIEKLRLHQKLLEIVNAFRKAAVYKINMENSVVSLYTNNKLYKEKLKK